MFHEKQIEGDFLKMSDYKDLRVWNKAHEMTLDIYKLTNGFPSREMYGLVSQIRRASSSIPTNIAEGCGTLHKKEFVRYLGIARGSCNEVEYQLILSKDLGYINEEVYAKTTIQIKDIQRMINGLIKSLQKRL